MFHPTFTIIRPTGYSGSVNTGGNKPEVSTAARKNATCCSTSRSPPHVYSEFTKVSVVDNSEHKMASRFVPGGTNEDPTERDEAWLKAQKEIESKRQQTASASQQEGGKSLYETLQANKGDFPPSKWHSQTYTTDESG
jgi:hypothetical protein